jgi:hypothetical protein
VYAFGTGVIWFAGSPWLLVNVLLMGTSQSRVILLSASFWLAIFVPTALIVVAAIRGKATGRSWLFLLPVCAFGLSAMAFIYGWLSRTISGEEASLLPMPLAVAIGVASLFVPLVLHIACCMIGALEGPRRAAA